MRIVHTSDWHAGRVWKNQDRLSELATILDNLVDFIKEETVDLVLLTGDVFDTASPPADAERSVFEFMRRVGSYGTQTIVIAGNHDSPPRLEAWATLAELAGVHVVARPRTGGEQGILTVTSRSGETAKIAAVPFAHARFLVSAQEIAGDETAAMQRYADGLRHHIAGLSQGFRANAVNLVMAHTHLEGAIFSRSERMVHIGEEWAALPQSLPADAHYTALGHIHKPQRITAAPGQAHYAGSPMQLDFGEAGEEKSFVLIEATAGQPAKVERVRYQGGKELAIWAGSLPELEQQAEALKNVGWLRVELSIDTPDPNINGTVRRLLPNAVVVSTVLPSLDREQVELTDTRIAQPEEAFSDYFLKQHSREPSEDLIKAFSKYYALAQQPEGE
jgi:exonuclease SbcD